MRRLFAVLSMLIAADGGGQTVQVTRSKPDVRFFDTARFQNAGKTLMYFTAGMPSTLNIGSPPLVTVNLETGAVKYALNYKPDEAARIFWEALGKEARCGER